MQNPRVRFLSVSAQGRTDAGGFSDSAEFFEIFVIQPPSGQEPPVESGRWRRGQALLLAASSDSAHNRHPSPFSKTTLSTQAGFSVCLLFFCSFPPGPSNPRRFPAERIHPSLPRWDAAGTAHSQRPRVGSSIQSRAARAAPRSCRPHARGAAGFGRGRFRSLQPTPKHDPAGAAPAPRS